MTITSEKMSRVTILAMKEDIETLLSEIARHNVLHPARIEEIDTWADFLDGFPTQTLIDAYAKRRRRIEEILLKVCASEKLPPLKEISTKGEVEIGEIDKEIERIEEELEPLILEKKEVSEKITELENLSLQVERIGSKGMLLARLMSPSSFLRSAIGTLPQKNLDRLHNLLSPIPCVILPYKEAGDRYEVVCIVLRRDKSRLDDALKQVGFIETPIPKELAEVSAGISSDLSNRLAALREKLEQIESRIRRIGLDNLSRIAEIANRIDEVLLVLKMKSYCRTTDRTWLISGWIPSNLVDRFVRAIRERTRNRVVVEVVDADKLIQTRTDIEVPVLIEHSPALKPFETLVHTYGIPSYKSIDPTPFLGLTFLFMFGMMFGDVGHGLALVIAGMITAIRSKKWRNIGLLGTYCGLASMIFGFLYGSLFGLDRILPTLWVRPLSGVGDLFKLAIGFGIVVISIGIIINILNSLIAHRFVENLFDKAGPVAGVIYWACIGLAVKWIVSGRGGFAGSFLYWIIALALLGFSLRGPILRLLRKQERCFPEGIGTYIMESAVEILEIFMGYLANTVSFIRIAAFGLAHAGLFVATFSLANLIASKPGGTVFSWLVLVFGNILIILLEGLVVTIQALRLEYYEFFGKFFKSAGSKYQPVGLAKS